MHYITAKNILSPHNGMNLYRGCAHGCIYCDSRSACYHMDHIFEDIAVKENGLALLEQTLRRKRKKGMIGLGAMSDPYQPIERELHFTRQAAEIALRYGFGFTLITKSAEVLRDLDIYEALNQQTRCVIQMTLTTLDDALCRKIEPYVSTTSERIAALKALRNAGIPTVVWLCPTLPYLNDTPENIGGLLDACAEAGVRGVLCFGMGLTLRDGNRQYFYQQLRRLFPALVSTYRQIDHGQYVIGSPHRDELMQLFHNRCAQHGMMHDNDTIFRYLAEYEEKPSQLSLFD